MPFVPKLGSKLHTEQRHDTERIQDGNKDDPSAVLYFGKSTVGLGELAAVTGKHKNEIYSQDRTDETQFIFYINKDHSWTGDFSWMTKIQDRVNGKNGAFE